MKRPSIKSTILSVIMILLVSPLYSCSSSQASSLPSVLPPSSFSEVDLIGTWQENGVADSEETIVLSSNHQYRQVFDNPETNYHSEQEGSWELKEAQNGCIYIHFYEMKYFYQDQELIDNGNRWVSGIRKGKAEKYWDECSENVIEMPNMVVMFVSQHPSYPKNIVLRDMAIQRDVVDIFFSLSSTME